MYFRPLQLRLNHDSSGSGSPENVNYSNTGVISSVFLSVSADSPYFNPGTTASHKKDSSGCYLGAEGANVSRQFYEGHPELEAEANRRVVYCTESSALDTRINLHDRFLFPMEPESPLHITIELKGESDRGTSVLGSAEVKFTDESGYLPELNGFIGERRGSADGRGEAHHGPGSRAEASIDWAKSELRRSDAWGNDASEEKVVKIVDEKVHVIGELKFMMG